MTTNPFVNASAAMTYIALVATVLFYGSSFVKPVDAVIMPIALLSLFVLSAAVMGYVFLFTPLQLFLSGAQREAARLFVSTVATFAIMTGVVFALVVLIGRFVPA